MSAERTSGCGAPNPWTIIGWGCLILLVLGLWGCLSMCTAVFGDQPQAAGLGDPARLVRTIDGDTVRVQTAAGEELVRLFGVDCPELRSGTAAAFEAAAFAARQLEAADAIRLERDDVCLRDRSGRSLAWVWYQRRGHWRLLDEELLRAGHAEVYQKCQSQRHMERLYHAASWH